MVDKKLIIKLVDVTGFTWSSNWWWRYYGKMVYGVTIVGDNLELAIKYPRYVVLEKLDVSDGKVKPDRYVVQIGLGDPDLKSKAQAMHNKMMKALDEDVSNLHTGYGSGF